MQPVTPAATTIKVRGFHLDVYGHVNNARYLEFFEEASWVYFDARGIFEALEARQLAFVSVNITVNYRRELFLGDTVEITSRVRDFGNKSGKLHHAMQMQGGAPGAVADFTATFVLLDKQLRRAVPLTPALQSLLTEGTG